MTTYTITEAQRHQLLEWIELYHHVPEVSEAINMVQSLTPNSGEVAAPSTGQPPIKFRHGCEWCGRAKCAESCPGAPSTSQPMTQEEATALAQRFGTAYTHRSAPGYTAYSFLPHTLMDFVRAIEAAHGITGSP